jgi:hypothetical protein
MAAATLLAGITIYDRESVYLGEIGGDHRLMQSENRAGAAGVPGVVCGLGAIFLHKTTRCGTLRFITSIEGGESASATSSGLGYSYLILGPRVLFRF